MEELRARQMGDVLGDREGPMGTSTLGMDDTLGNTLAIEVGERVEEMEVWTYAGRFGVINSRVRSSDRCETTLPWRSNGPLAPIR